MFSNVGDDAEHPTTLRYVREIAIPYAAAHGFPVHEIHPVRNGERTTIVREIVEKERDIIPFFGEAGNPLSRSCTADFKIKTIHRWLKEQGATKSEKATVLLGISTDEIERAGRGKDGAVEIREYPLLTLGMNRTDCERVIREGGLPVPPKSSCFFCPFHSELVWQELRRDDPALFQRAQEIEDAVQARKASRGHRQVFLTRKGSQTGQRLSDVIATAGEMLFQSEIGADGCDSGFCWT